jgi:hypothetical protein
LFLGDLGNIVSELFVGIARVAGASLGFHDGEHVAACVVKAIVGDAIPWLRVIAINWNLEADLGAVVEIPVSGSQLRIDLQDASLGFVESHGDLRGIALKLAAGATGSSIGVLAQFCKKFD